MFTVAIAASDDDHAPPGIVLTIVLVLPAHTGAAPDKTPGSARVPVETVTTEVVVQPPAVYVISAVPTATPVTIPDDSPAVAMAALLLAHVPPVAVCERNVIAPAHTVRAPDIEPIGALTVTSVVRRQPVLIV